MRTLGISRLRPEAIADACAQISELQFIKKKRLFGYFRSWELRGVIDGVKVGIIPCPSGYADFLVRVWYPSGQLTGSQLIDALGDHEPSSPHLRADRLDNRIEFAELGIDVPPKASAAGRQLVEAATALVGLVRRIGTG